MLHPSYPCTALLSILSSATYPSTALLHTTFGSDTRCVSRFFSKFKDKPHLLEIHLTNETFRRNRAKVTQYEIAPRLGVRDYNRAIERKDKYLLKRIERRVQWINKYIVPLANENTKIILSTGLEDNYTKKAYEIIREEIKRTWKGDLVRNPLHIPPDCRDTSGVKYCELHLPESNFGSRTCIWNNDGNFDGVQYQSELFTKFRKCSVLLAWTKSGQGIGDKFVEPRRRTFIISNRDISDYRRLLTTHK